MYLTKEDLDPMSKYKDLESVSMINGIHWLKMSSDLTHTNGTQPPISSHHRTVWHCCDSGCDLHTAVMLSNHFWCDHNRISASAMFWPATAEATILSDNTEPFVFWSTACNHTPHTTCLCAFIRTRGTWFTWLKLWTPTCHKLHKLPLHNACCHHTDRT